MLKQILNETGITQAQLAKGSDISARTISNYCNGQKIGADNSIKMSTYLNHIRAKRRESLKLRISPEFLIKLNR